MIKLLKSIGYKFVDKKTLNNSEFRVSTQTKSINEDYSTFAKQVYDSVIEYELFLKTEVYTDKKMSEILDSTRGEGIDDITMSIDKKENGFLITFITTEVK